MPLINDPIDLLLDADGDLVVTDDLAFSRGLESVAQGVRIRVQRFRGEWFLDLNAGVPYLENDRVSESEALLGQRYNESKARTAFRDAILSAPGVRELTELSVTFDARTRRLTVSWRVTTEFGDTAGAVEV
jgi:hypothetical protein